MNGRKKIIIHSETTSLPLDEKEQVVLARVANHHVKKVAERGPTSRKTREKNKLYFELDGYLKKNSWMKLAPGPMNGYLLVNLLGVLNDSGCLDDKCGHSHRDNDRLSDRLNDKIKRLTRQLAVNCAVLADHCSWSISVMGSTGGEEVVPALINILGNYQNDYKWLAADALGRVARRTGNKKATGALVKLARKGNNRLREKACEMLAETGDPRAVAVLVEKLADRSKPVVRRAVKSLGKTGAPETAGPLQAMLELENNSWLQRYHLLEAVCRTAKKLPVEIVREAFKSKRRSTRAAAARGCLRTGVSDNPELLQLVEKQLRRERDIRICFDLEDALAGGELPPPGSCSMIVTGADIYFIDRDCQ